MARLLNRLRQGSFAVTVEVNPPKGADVSKTLALVRRFSDRVDAVNVADCPMANVRMSPITLAHLIQRDVGVEAIFHLTCRDRNTIGLQAELLGASGLGVRNILALRGDPPSRGDHPEAHGVFEVDAVGLISLAAALNSGHTVGGGELGEGTDFAIGCVANPNAEDLEAEISRLEEKIAAGAHFVQTQPIFDVRAYERWANAIDGRVSIPILYGILPIKDAAFAVHLKENVPGMEVPDWVIDRMRSGGDGEGYRLAAELLSEIGKDIAGIHIFPMNSSKRVVGVLDALAEEGFAVPPVQTACDGLRKVAPNG
ncbi:MAG TPA: methylenetetrahydrofolate reductase [Bacillota bacterium]|nr:methylenetetrahydrofolate reductase [Bacillota bacterium]HOO31093.1 methylenetetrahydrofolate reductase [Bacillota bacterium]HPQ02052.1 methylenetetrahydrofolate reductase [Bacillota bacterium]HPZ13457.1 methylenetetrahydrofolate reductase [Bacillota bacterium]